MGFTGRARIHATVKDLRWYGADLDFRRSPRTLRVRYSAFHLTDQ